MDLKAKAKEGEKLIRENPRMDLRIEEYRSLLEESPSYSEIFEAITQAFYYGVSQGYKIGKKDFTTLEEEDLEEALIQREEELGRILQQQADEASKAMLEAGIPDLEAEDLPFTEK